MGALLQERLARGEQAAFAELYDACADRLHHYLLVRLGSRTDADDALQETFLRLARTRERLAKVESLEAAVGQRLLKRAAIGAGRAHRQARMEMKLLQAGQLPNRRAPAHALDVPDVVAIGDCEYRDGPSLSRPEAFQQASEQNRRHLADGDAWNGRWCVVVELSDPLPNTWACAEFAATIGVEDLISRRAVRLVHPTAAELAQFTSRKPLD